jgi:uncharacterized protein (DUF2141 family)
VLGRVCFSSVRQTQETQPITSQEKNFGTTVRAEAQKNKDGSVCFAVERRQLRGLPQKKEKRRTEKTKT